MTDAERVEDADRARLAAFFGTVLPEQTVERIFEDPRFKKRSAALAINSLGPLPSLDFRQAVLLDYSLKDFQKFWSLVGGIWNARPLSKVVGGQARRSLADRFGSDFYGVVLKGRHLARAERVQDLDNLIRVIEEDGWACCAAWCQTQPRPVAARLEMCSRMSKPNAAHSEHAPAIVDWLLDDRGS